MYEYNLDDFDNAIKKISEIEKIGIDTLEKLKGQTCQLKSCKNKIDDIYYDINYATIIINKIKGLTFFSRII